MYGDRIGPHRFVPQMHQTRVVPHVAMGEQHARLKSLVRLGYSRQIIAQYSDPIVEEVREAGQLLASEAGNDVHRFFDKLREAQAGYGKPLVREPVPARQG